MRATSVTPARTAIDRRDRSRRGSPAGHTACRARSSGSSCTPGICATRHTSSRARWMYVSEPLISASSTRPRSAVCPGVADEREFVRADAQHDVALACGSSRAASPGAIGSRTPSASTASLRQSRPGGNHIQRRIAEGARGFERCRSPEHLQRRTRLQHATCGEQSRVAAQLQRLLRLGRRVHDSRSSARKQLRELRAQLFAKLVVEIDERLIEQQQLGVLRERTSQRRSLLLTARQLRRIARQERRESQRLARAASRAPRSPLRSCARHATARRCFRRPSATDS